MGRIQSVRWASVLVAAPVLSLSMGVSGVEAQPIAGQSAPPQCTQSQVRSAAVTDHTAYPPGRAILMTSSIKNVSRSSCTIFLGAVPGWSPTFTVTNRKGTVVWDGCWVNDQPGACATVLRSHTLRPHQTYKEMATWDQRSGPDGQTPRQVPQGQYTFSTHYRYITGTASATFVVIVG
jgi:hypothetical protein